VEVDSRRELPLEVVDSLRARADNPEFVRRYVGYSKMRYMIPG
jgi:hypothetical protein